MAVVVVVFLEGEEGSLVEEGVVALKAVIHNSQTVVATVQEVPVEVLLIPKPPSSLQEEIKGLAMMEERTMSTRAKDFAARRDQLELD